MQESFLKKTEGIFTGAEACVQELFQVDADHHPESPVKAAVEVISSAVGEVLSFETRRGSRIKFIATNSAKAALALALAATFVILNDSRKLSKDDIEKAVKAVNGFVTVTEEAYQQVSNLELEEKDQVVKKAAEVAHKLAAALINSKSLTDSLADDKEDSLLIKASEAAANLYLDGSEGDHVLTPLIEAVELKAIEFFDSSKVASPLDESKDENNGHDDIKGSNPSEDKEQSDDIKEDKKDLDNNAESDANNKDKKNITVIISYTNDVGELYVLRKSQSPQTKFPATPITDSDPVTSARNYAGSLLKQEAAIVVNQTPAYQVHVNQKDHSIYYNVHLGNKSSERGNSPQSEIEILAGNAKEKNCEFTEANTSDQRAVVSELTKFLHQQKPNLPSPFIIKTLGNDCNCLLESMLMWIVVQSQNGDKATKAYIKSKNNKFQDFFKAIQVDSFDELADLSVNEMQKKGGIALRKVLADLLEKEDARQQHRSLLEATLESEFDQHPRNKQDSAIDVFDGVGLNFVRNKFDELNVLKIKENEEERPANEDEKKNELLKWWKKEGHEKYLQHILKPGSFLSPSEAQVLAEHFGFNLRYMRKKNIQLTNSGEQYLNRPTVTVRHTGKAHWEGYLPGDFVKKYNEKRSSEDHQLKYEEDKSITRSAVSEVPTGIFSTQKHFEKLSTVFKEEAPWISEYSPLEAQKNSNQDSYTLTTKDESGKYSGAVKLTRTVLTKSAKKSGEQLRITASYTPEEGKALSKEAIKAFELQQIARAYAEEFKAESEPGEVLKIDLVHIGKTWKEAEAIKAFEKVGFEVYVNGALKSQEETVKELKKKAKETAEKKRSIDSGPVQNQLSFSKAVQQQWSSSNRQLALAGVSTLVGAAAAYYSGGSRPGLDFVDATTTLGTSLLTAMGFVTVGGAAIGLRNAMSAVSPKVMFNAVASHMSSEGARRSFVKYAVGAVVALNLAYIMYGSAMSDEADSLLGAVNFLWINFIKPNTGVFATAAAISNVLPQIQKMLGQKFFSDEAINYLSYLPVLYGNLGGARVVGGLLSYGASFIPRPAIGAWLSALGPAVSGMSKKGWNLFASLTITNGTEAAKQVGEVFDSAKTFIGPQLPNGVTPKQALENAVRLAQASQGHVKSAVTEAMRLSESKSTAVALRNGFNIFESATTTTCSATPSVVYSGDPNNVTTLAFWVCSCMKDGSSTALKAAAPFVWSLAKNATATAMDNPELTLYGFASVCGLT